MNWTYNLKIVVCLLFFVCLVIVGTNVSAQQLAIVTNKDITPPFLVTPLADNTIRLDVLGDSYQYSVLPIQNRYSFLKSSIQNSWVTVKFNLAPRSDYLRYQWNKGVKQLTQDLTNIIHNE